MHADSECRFAFGLLIAREQREPPPSRARESEYNFPSNKHTNNSNNQPWTCSKKHIRSNSLSRSLAHRHKYLYKKECMHFLLLRVLLLFCLFVCFAIVSHYLMQLRFFSYCSEILDQSKEGKTTHTSHHMHMLMTRRITANENETESNKCVCVSLVLLYAYVLCTLEERNSINWFYCCASSNVRQKYHLVDIMICDSIRFDLHCCHCHNVTHSHSY